MVERASAGNLKAAWVNNGSQPNWLDRTSGSKTSQGLEYRADPVLEFALVVGAVAVEERVTTCCFGLFVGRHAQGQAKVRLVPIIFTRRGAGRISGRPVFPSPRPKSGRRSPSTGS